MSFRTKSSRVTGLAAAVLVAATSAACTDDGARDEATGNASSTEATPAGGPDTGHLFLTGTVTDGGEPQPEVRVWLTLHPESDDIPPGTTVDTWDSKPVTTDTDGRYTITLDPDAVPGKYFPTSHEYLNFQLLAATDEHLATWHSTLWLAGRPQVWRTQQSTADDRVSDMSLDLGEETITVTDSQGDAETDELPVGPVPRLLAGG